MKPEVEAAIARLDSFVGFCAGFDEAEQQVADDIRTLTTALREAEADRERLDWLDSLTDKTNEHYGTRYGWKFETNHNRSEVFLADCFLPALTVRAAIDAARKESE